MIRYPILLNKRYYVISGVSGQRFYLSLETQQFDQNKDFLNLKTYILDTDLDEGYHGFTEFDISSS